jgi:phospholipase C
VHRKRIMRFHHSARKIGVLLGAVVISFLLSGPNLANPARAQSTGLTGPATFVSIYGPPLAASSVPLQHIVVIMQENHAYDNFFGTYCTFLGPLCPVTGNGAPNGTCIPFHPATPSAGCSLLTPFPNASFAQALDIGHDWNNSHAAYNGGLMNGFYDAEGHSLRTFRYFNGSTLPTYWNYAEQYALSDNFFSPYLSYSLSNHWAMFAGQAPNVTQNFTMYGPNILVKNGGPNHVGLYSFQKAYLDAANATPTIADQLSQVAGAGLLTPSWTYYDTKLTPGAAGYNFSIKTGGAFNYWAPGASKAESYVNPAMNSHYADRNRIFSDLASNALPNLAWVLPNFTASDHPIAEVPQGEAWVTSVINAIENSSAWNSTAIFVSWDEYGGFYDHVAPPQLDSLGLGFRVPLLIISPYARQGYIDHQFGSFESLLHLMEWRYGLPPIGIRKTATPLPLNAFDFQQSPRAPFLLPTGPVGALPYPQPLQASPAVGMPTGLTAVDNGTAVQLSWTPPIGGASVDAYSIRYGPPAAPTEFAATVDGAADGATVYNASSRTGYLFSVESIGPGSVSAWTPTATIAARGSSGPMAWVWSNAPYLVLGAAVVVAIAVALGTTRGRRTTPAKNAPAPPRSLPEAAPSRR